MRCGGKRAPNCVKWLEVFHVELWEKGGGGVKQRRTTWTQYAALVSGNKWGTIETISVCIYSGQGDIKAVVCLTLCQSHTSVLNCNIAKQHTSNLVSLEAKLGVSAFNWKTPTFLRYFYFHSLGFTICQDFITTSRTKTTTAREQS